MLRRMYRESTAAVAAAAIASRIIFRSTVCRAWRSSLSDCCSALCSSALMSAIICDMRCVSCIPTICWRCSLRMMSPELFFSLIACWRRICFNTSAMVSAMSTLWLSESLTSLRVWRAMCTVSLRCLRKASTSRAKNVFFVFTTSYTVSLSSFISTAFCFIITESCPWLKLFSFSL